MTRAIRTPRLILRRARATDLADLHQVMRQPQAMRYWSTPEHDSIEETRLWLQSMLILFQECLYSHNNLGLP